MKNRYILSFTLIELLVVIAIIAILAGMLLPTLSKARDSGKQTLCTNNLRQLGASVIMYAGDWGEYLPGIITGSGNFMTGLEPYTNVVVSYSPAVNPKIYFCPSDTYRSGITSNPALRFYSYGQNYYCRWDGVSVPGMKKVTGIKKPSLITYLIDSQSTASGREGWPVTFSVNTWPFNMSAENTTGGDFRHRSLMNILYIDTHTGKTKLPDIMGTGIKYTVEL